MKFDRLWVGGWLICVAACDRSREIIVRYVCALLCPSADPSIRLQNIAPLIEALYTKSFFGLPDICSDSYQGNERTSVRVPFLTCSILSVARVACGPVGSSVSLARLWWKLSCAAPLLLPTQPSKRSHIFAGLDKTSVLARGKCTIVLHIHRIDR